jgi:nucleotide-binding universal stress UspA family protein
LGQDQYLAAAKAEARAVMDAAVQRLRQAGVEADISVVEAHAVWRGIQESATRLKADLLILGSHGRRGLEKLVLGSVTQSVLSHTKITTLVVRDESAKA